MGRTYTRGWPLIVMASRALRSISLGLALWSGAGAISAQTIPDQSVQAPASAPVVFDIRPQSLITALDAFGAASGVQVLYGAALSPGQHLSPGVIGRMSPEAALGILLRGTGFTPRYISPRDVVLVTESTTEAEASAVPPATTGPVYSLETLRAEAPPGPRDWTPLYKYAALVQRELQNALRSDRQTGPRSFRAGLRIWVGPSGVIQRSEISNSTGDVRLDSAISRALAGVVVGPTPPENLPQPIHVTITKRSAN